MKLEISCENYNRSFPRYPKLIEDKGWIYGVCLQPWLESPYALISWLAMLEFSALEFYEIGTEIEMLILISEGFDATEKIGKAETVHETLNKIENLCAGIS